MNNSYKSQKYKGWNGLSNLYIFTRENFTREN